MLLDLNLALHFEAKNFEKETPRYSKTLHYQMNHHHSKKCIIGGITCLLIPTFFIKLE